MTNLFQTGVDLRTAPIEQRETARRSVEVVLRQPWAFRGHAAEAWLLATCHRAEIYLVDPVEPPVLVAERLLGTSPTVTRRGREAVRHLLRVAAGLESQVLGEDQILQQVRAGLSWGRESGLLGPILYRVIHQALCSGRAIRARTKLASGVRSVPALALRLAARAMNGLAGRDLVIFGAGETSRIAATYLAAAGAQITVTARRADAAEAFAAEFNCAWTPWPERGAIARRSELIVLATAALEPVLSASDLVGGRRPLVVVDLGLPRNADRETAKLEGLTVLDLDSLGGSVDCDERIRREAVGAAEKIVDEGISEFDEWLERRLARALVSLRGG